MLSHNTLEALSEEFCKIAEEQTFLDRAKAFAHRTKETVTDKENLKKALPYAAGGVAALGTYGLMRRFKQHKNPALAALQREAKNKNVIYQVDSKSKADRLLLGAKSTNLSDQVGKGHVVINSSSNPVTAKGDVMINTDLATDLNDKLTFDRIMNKGWQGGSGPTHGKPVTAKDTKLLINALKGKDVKDLAKQYPDGFVIKPRHGSMGKIEDLITSVDDPKLLNMSKAQRSKHIVQEKLPIKEEFRVHVINGVPFTATQRRIKNNTIRKVWNKVTGSEGGGAFVPVTGKKRKDMMKFVEESHGHLNDSFSKGNHTHVAYDVAELKDGSFRLIEANPAPGTMRNPITSRKLNRMVTGRWGRDVSALAGLGVGGATGLGAKKIKDTLNKE